MRASLSAFVSGPIGKAGSMVSASFTLASLVQFATATGEPFVTLSAALGVLLALSFWRFHQMFQAQSAEQKGVVARLRDLLRQGREREAPLVPWPEDGEVDSWETWTQVVSRELTMWPAEQRRFIEAGAIEAEATDVFRLRASARLQVLGEIVASLEQRG